MQTLTSIQLGREYRDMITGRTGICTAKVEYISGCHQVCIQPKDKPDGSAVDGVFFDVQRLEETSNIETIKLQNEKAPGFGKAPTVR